jgi:hypothetical protein
MFISTCAEYAELTDSLQIEIELAQDRAGHRAVHAAATMTKRRVVDVCYGNIRPFLIPTRDGWKYLLRSIAPGWDTLCRRELASLEERR